LDTKKIYVGLYEGPPHHVQLGFKRGPPYHVQLGFRRGPPYHHVQFLLGISGRKQTLRKGWPPTSPPPFKHLEKICSVCGGHLIPMNFPLRNWEGYYAYSPGVGEKLCLLIGVRTLPLLRSRHKNPSIHMPCDLHSFDS